MEITKWEYQKLYFNNTGEDKLKELGKKGWECCGMAQLYGNAIVLLKRPCGRLQIREKIHTQEKDNEYSY